MPIVFRCPACGRDLECSEDAVNAEGSCRFCGAHIVSPSGTDSPATLIAPGPSASFPGAPSTSQPTGVLRPFQILSEAWSLYQSQMGVLVLGMLIAGLLQSVVTQVWIHVPTVAGSRWGETSGGALGALMAPLTAGPLYLAARVVSGRQVSLRHLFQGFSHAAPLITCAFLLGIPWLIAFAFYPLPIATPGHPMDLSALHSALLRQIGIGAIMTVALLPLSLATMEIVDRGCGPLEAFRASLDATRGRYLALFATRIVLFAVSMSGFLL